jgi:signal transduction histidine kinase
MQVDVDKCDQVLRNIISNALKFTPAFGTVKLVYKLVNALGEPVIDLNESLEKQDVIFRFEVHDTGPGMSQVCIAYCGYCRLVRVIILISE